MTQLGQYEDSETPDLYYNRFRYYDPSTGLYLSQDPIGLAGNNPTLYAYVKDSNKLFDPFGLECWDTARKNFWKNEAANNPHLYSQNNLARMNDGKAPRMTVEVTNRKTGVTSIKDYSLELHHTNIPQRVGGTGVHNSSNLTIVDPWQHEAVDSFRHVGSDLDAVIKGVDVW
ncbi:RHS repeat-associated core domain-containing protein [Flavobacterium oreochromis]|uniref:RHS repeat-associated core domain-containing protein n=1 Tax=Flavobacterium oreochromis TaxID=2906078 RepID=UPI00385E8410